MEMDINEKCLLFTVVAVIMVIAVMAGYIWGSSKLGQAICEEEYNMDLKGYGNGILRCEHKVQTEQYDGIEVKINDGEPDFEIGGLVRKRFNSTHYVVYVDEDKGGN